MYIVRTNAERMCAPTREDAACSSQTGMSTTLLLRSVFRANAYGRRGRMGADTHMDPFSC